MPAHMPRTETWVLLIDAAHARVLRRPERHPETATAPLETILDLATRHRPLREIMADRPGREHSSVGHGRSAMEYASDPVRDETRRFAQAVLADLEDRLANDEFSRLIVYAPPRMLGILREEMPAALARTVAAEHAKDVLKLPERDLLDLLLAAD